MPSRRWLFRNRIRNLCIPANPGGQSIPVTANIGKIGLTPHVETIAVLGRGFRDFDAVNSGAVRPLAQQIRQPLYGLGVALKLRLDRAIRAVTNPAGDTQPLRLLAGPGAEEDALHQSGDPDPSRDHQTVAMSGASSAFIPTTL